MNVIWGQGSNFYSLSLLAEDTSLMGWERWDFQAGTSPKHERVRQATLRKKKLILRLLGFWIKSDFKLVMFCNKYLIDFLNII